MSGATTWPLAPPITGTGTVLRVSGTNVTAENYVTGTTFSDDSD